MKPYKIRIVIIGLLITAFAAYDLYRQIDNVLNDRNFVIGQNIALLVVGVLLISCNLKIVAGMANIFAFFLTAFGCFMIPEIIRFPASLTVMAISQGDFAFLGNFFLFIIFGICLLLFLTIRSKSVLKVMEEAGIENNSKRPAILFGLFMGLFFTIIQLYFYFGDQGKTIENAVAERYGSDYRCWIRGFSTGTGGTKARSYIYNAKEYRYIKVSFDTFGFRLESAEEITIIEYCDDGAMLDTQTGLMWAAKDNGKNINWHFAKKYCETYTGGGYDDWRLPTQAELRRFYEAEIWRGERGVNHWASDTKESTAAYVGGRWGREFFSPQSDFVNYRALPVRENTGF